MWQQRRKGLLKRLCNIIHPCSAFETSGQTKEQRIGAEISSLDGLAAQLGATAVSRLSRLPLKVAELFLHVHVLAVSFALRFLPVVLPWGPLRLSRDRFPTKYSRCSFWSALDGAFLVWTFAPLPKFIIKISACVH